VRVVSIVEYDWRSALMTKRKVTAALRKASLKKIPACGLQLVQIKRQPKILNPLHWNQIKKFLMFL
jgi:hypothetical protein